MTPRKTKRASRPDASTPIEIMPGVFVSAERIGGFKPDPRNLNRHTARGHSTLTHEIQTDGIGRSIFVTADDVIKAGNLTQEVITETLGDKTAIVVSTRGDVPIVHRRLDVHSDDERADRMALADNWIAKLSLNFDSQAVAALAPAVRDQLWEKACVKIKDGSVLQIWNTANEQGFTMRSWNEPTYRVRDFEGVLLVEHPIEESAKPNKSIAAPTVEAQPPNVTAKKR